VGKHDANTMHLTREKAQHQKGVSILSHPVWDWEISIWDVCVNHMWKEYDICRI